MPGMIVAPQPLAVEEGANVLAGGGNAYDAALAAAAVQFIIDPHSCGVGGYLLMTHRPAGGKPAAVIDAPATAGGRVTPDMWREALIGPNPGGWGYFLKGKVNEVGYQSICTPAMVRGMDAILRSFGTLGWGDLLSPAIRIAHEGYTVTAHLAGRWKEPPMFYELTSQLQKLHASPEARRIYLKDDGSPHEMGETLRNPDYGRTLERLVEHGPDGFYTGELGREIAADLDANNAWVTAGDLQTCAARSERALTTSYRGYTVVSPPPPHGGPTLAAMLNILEGCDVAALAHNSPEYIHLVSMAMKAAFADRNRLLGDPQFIDVPLEWMISKERAAEWRGVIDAGRPIDVARAQPGPPDTTQVTVVDAAGNCVSLTHSLGSSSGVITPGLGFMYNNSMVNFDPLPSRPNSIAAGKGRTTGMTPTIVMQDDRPVLVLGAPGATRIITSVLQVILNRLDFGMSIAEAVHAPRFDCQGDVISCQARIPETVCIEVRRRHDCQKLPRSHGGFGLVHAIAIDSQTGALSGAADTGADGMALLVA